MGAQGVTFACINAATTGDAAPAKKEEDSKEGEASVDLSTFAFRCATSLTHVEPLTLSTFNCYLCPGVQALTHVVTV